MVSTKYFGDNNGSIKISGTHIDKPMEDMTRQINENLNSFIDEFNGSNKQANRATAISYFAAVAVSLFSFCLSLIEKVY
ncbi:MAG: hypothetical protein KJ864_02700 [Candidatus Omnitrophica bacterium]|nr:hypothetical protein [Candidatus Omnitrophota bacterium]